VLCCQEGTWLEAKLSAPAMSLTSDDGHLKRIGGHWSKWIKRERSRLSGKDTQKQTTMRLAASAPLGSGLAELRCS
jgi:hypothetical protein